MWLCALPDAVLHVVLCWLTTLDAVGLRGINRYFRGLVRDHPWCDASTLVPHGRVAQWVHAFPRAWLMAYDVSDRGRKLWWDMPEAEDIRHLGFILVFSTKHHVDMVGSALSTMRLRIQMT